MHMKTLRHSLAILVLITAPATRAGEIDDLLAKASEGDAGAQYEIGQKYSKGDGVPKNPGDAVKWLEKSAAQGNADAQLSLGSIYISGRGAPKNSVEAAKWFQLAAEQGRGAAQIQIARMHLAGAGVVKDDVMACKWARLAMAQGEKQANQILVLLGSRMTALETAQAETLVREYLAKKTADDAARGIPSVAPPLE